MRTFISIFTLLIFSILSACAPSAEISGQAFAVTNPTVPTGGTVLLPGADALDSEEAQFLNLINSYRQQNGLVPLVSSLTLTRAAAWLSEDFGSNTIFSHTDSLGRDPFTRMSFFGYPAVARAENIAAGRGTAQGAFDQWRNSPGHNENMLRSSLRAIGIGRAYVAGSRYGWYWTTDFGSVTD